MSRNSEMVPFPWKSEANICSPTLCKNQSFTLPWKKKHAPWFMAEEKKLRFSLTSCSTPSTCLMYCLQLCFLWKVSVCVSTAPNRLTETDEFFLHFQLFPFLIVISCFSLLNHLLHLLFQSVHSFICTDLRFSDTSRRYTSLAKHLWRMT